MNGREAQELIQHARQYEPDNDALVEGGDYEDTISSVAVARNVLRKHEKQVTEVTFEVTVRHFVTESDPNPTGEDVRVAVERHLEKTFYLEQVRAERI